jgi:hypothetical protein
METIALKSVYKAHKLLSASNVSFLIVLPNGKRLGNLEAAQKAQSKRGKGQYHYGYGAVKGYIFPFVKDLAVGGIAKIPFNGMKPKVLASGVYKTVTELWGKGSATYCTNKNHIQVMRLK